MKDLKIKFNGATGTTILLDEIVTGKLLSCQKYLVNTVTNRGTDIIFSDRGTTLFSSAIGGALIDSNTTIHICNFAAIDTLYFCSYEEHADIFDSDEYISAYSLSVLDYDNDNKILHLKATMTFKDNTQTVENEQVKFELV